MKAKYIYTSVFKLSSLLDKVFYSVSYYSYKNVKVSGRALPLYDSSSYQ